VHQALVRNTRLLALRGVAAIAFGVIALAWPNLTFVALTATNAAKLYGLYPRKGSIAIGADADLVIWDCQREFSLTNSQLHHNVDYTPYEGWQMRAWPAMTLSRGEVVWDGTEPTGEPGRGQVLKALRPQLAKPRNPLAPRIGAHKVLRRFSMPSAYRS